MYVVGVLAAKSEGNGTPFHVDFMESTSLLRSYGVLPLKQTYKVKIITDRVIVPIEWDEKVLLKLYGGLEDSINNLLLLVNLPKSIHIELNVMLDEILEKNREHSTFLKYYSEANKLVNATLQFGRHKRQIALAAMLEELQIVILQNVINT